MHLLTTAACQRVRGQVHAREYRSHDDAQRLAVVDVQLLAQHCLRYARPVPPDGHAVRVDVRPGVRQPQQQLTPIGRHEMVAAVATAAAAAVAVPAACTHRVFFRRYVRTDRSGEWDGCVIALDANCAVIEAVEFAVSARLVSCVVVCVSGCVRV